MPIGRGQHAQANKREHVPVRRCLLVDRHEEIKGEDRQPEPNKIEHFELLVRTAPIRNDSPGESQKNQRREEEKMCSEKSEQLARVNADCLIQASPRT